VKRTKVKKERVKDSARKSKRRDHANPMTWETVGLCLFRKNKKIKGTVKGRGNPGGQQQNKREKHW